MSSGSKSIVLQDVFLNLIRKERIPALIHLSDSTKIAGMIKGFDSFTVIVESEGKQLMVYKNAISMVVPSKPVLT